MPTGVISFALRSRVGLIYDHCAVWKCFKIRECSENVQRMFRECSENVQRMFRECSENVQRMFRECSENAHRMLILENDFFRVYHHFRDFYVEMFN